MSFDRRVFAASLALLLVLTGAAFAQKGGPASQTPRAVVPELTVDLGQVLEGQTYEHVFKIQNAGNVELQILSVRPG